MDRNEAIFFADQLSAAIKEICNEEGYDVDVSIAVDIGGSMAFTVDPKGMPLTQEIIDDILHKATLKIGCEHEC